MILSENFKKRLMELAGVSAGKNIITEADKRNVIINKLKIPKEIADFSHNLSDKYSIWIANSIKNQILKDKTLAGLIGGEKLIKDIMSLPSFASIGKNPENSLEFKRAMDIEKFIKNIEGDYTYILDWLKGRTTLASEHDQINFKTLTFEDAKNRSILWHNKLKEIQGGKISDEDGEVILNFPDGFYWIRLGRDYCEKEAEAMGHCGRATGSVLYSLRKEQYPYVTVAVKEETGVVVQMKGRANTKPKTDFHKYIIPFILGVNPNVQYFSSTYQADTDFNINDLSDVELRDVISKKPSLLMENGAIAIKRLSEQEIQNLLVKHPSVFRGWKDNVVLSDILRNGDMVDWAIDNAPELFHKYKFGTLKLTKEQLFKALSNESISANLSLDEMNFDDEALNWIVYNQPRMFEESVGVIEKLNDIQKDYLVKNHPIAFKEFLALLEHDNVVYDKKIINFLGTERLKKLFVKSPILFSQGRISYYVFGQFLTPGLLENYVKAHNKQNDPLNIFNNIRRLSEINRFMNMNTAYYLLKHYPDDFWASSTMVFANKEGGKVIGKYIVDHHFEWIDLYITNHRGSKFNIQDWELSPAQKQKIVNSDAEGDTTILINYDEHEIRKLNLTPKQVQQLLSSSEFTDNLNIDLIKGFSLAPDREQTKEAILKFLLNNEDENLTIVNEIGEMYGEEYVQSLYNINPEAFVALDFPVKYRDIERLKKYNNQSISYTNEGIKIRFDDWSDDDLIELFKNSDIAEKIANHDLDFYSYDYKFKDIDDNFNSLDQVNIARVRFLIGKAFPAEFKKTIKAMSVYQLVNSLNDPEDVYEDYVDEILDGIKDAFVRTIEDCQQNADEGEYWDLYTDPIENLFGKPKFVNIKTQKKGEEVKDVQMLEFEMSYGEFEEFIKDAGNSGNYNNDGVITTKDYATSVVGIVKYALEDRDAQLEVNEPYYGVNGSIEKSDLNERFGELLFEDTNLDKLLSKTKIVVKKKENES